MTNYIGAGRCPAGRSIAGYGVPGTTDVIQGIPLAKSDATSADARRIDPQTRDFVVDEVTGRIEGMNSAQQQVYLALVTIKGSSADPNLGTNISRIQVFNDNTQADVENEVKQALSLLLNSGTIKIIKIETGKFGTTLGVKVTWRDISTNTVNYNII